MTKISTNLKEGEKLARLSYLTVVKKTGNIITVKNEQDFKWDISIDILDNECTSATQFFALVKVSQSEMIEKLMEAGHNVFTANFNKKPDKKLALKKLQELYPNKGIKGVGIAKRDDFNYSVKKILDSVFDGEERIITCRINSIDKLRGRVTVIDLETSDEHKLRQIDPRTLNWLIIKGIKYEIK
jgi:hypothetical protein